MFKANFLRWWPAALCGMGWVLGWCIRCRRWWRASLTDRARLALFRDYLGGDELAYQRFLADLRADPGRYYPPALPGDPSGRF
jgi:hypothetical protein